MCEYVPTNIITNIDCVEHLFEFEKMDIMADFPLETVNTIGHKKMCELFPDHANKIKKLPLLKRFFKKTLVCNEDVLGKIEVILTNTNIHIKLSIKDDFSCSALMFAT